MTVLAQRSVAFGRLCPEPCAAHHRVRFGDRQKFVVKKKYRGAKKDGISVKSKMSWRNKRRRRGEIQIKETNAI